MSCTRDYPIVSGEKHTELPKKTKARYILLPECQLYHKKAQHVFCNKCKTEHQVYKWTQIFPKCDIAFVDIGANKVTIISTNTNTNTNASTNLIPNHSSGSGSSSNSDSQPCAKLDINNVGKIDKVAGILTYVIKVTNNSSSAANDVIVMVSLPNVGTCWLTVHPKNKCEMTGNELKCQFGTINPDQSVMIKVYANIRPFCKSSIDNQEVFCSVRAIASNAKPENAESITIVPCMCI